MRQWNEVSVSETALEFGTDVKGGKREVNRNRKSLNTVIRVPAPDTARIFKALASDASLLMLAVTYLIASFTGYLYESVVGLAFSVTVFAMGCYIKYRSAKRVSNSYRLLLPTAKVTENQSPLRLSVFDVEVGDLITFSKGDFIPADARIVSASSLRVSVKRLNEQTGKEEYVAYDKCTDICLTPSEIYDGFSNMVYAGSVVTYGKGSAIVTATGNDTRLALSGSRVSVAVDNDNPRFLDKFVKETKRVALFISASLIPICMIGIYRQTRGEAQINILYTFLTLVALAATCMSDLVTVPAEALVTKEILPSSRIRIANRNRQSKITKLSDTERIANADSIVILSPDVLIDGNIKVRQAYFSGVSLRFDGLFSSAMQNFMRNVLPMYSRAVNLNGTERIIRDFVLNGVGPKNPDTTPYKLHFVRDASKRTRICILNKDAQGRPVRFVAQSEDFSLLAQCEAYRTDDNATNKLDDAYLSKAQEWLEDAKNRGLAVYLYISSEDSSSPSVFEGMIAVGREFPYADRHDDILQSLQESGIKPILIFESEAKQNIETIMRYGIVPSEEDIVFASTYADIGLDYTSVPLNAAAYVGFGPKDTPLLIKRLRASKNEAIYVLRDTSDKNSIPSDAIYAIHDTASHDTVKISASMSLQPADAFAHCGGLADALNLIKRSAMSYLKLGVYRNYLIFSLFMRVFCVCLPMLFDNSVASMSSTMILFSGFFCDYMALLAIMYSNGLPVRPKDTVDDAKRLFSPSLYVLYACSAAVAAGAAFLLASKSVASGLLTPESSPWFMMYALIAANMFSLGGLLPLLMKRARRFAFNVVYFSQVVIIIVLMIGQSYVPSGICDSLSHFGFTTVNVKMLPCVGIVALIAFLCSFIIDRLISSITSFGK
ncbi:MAG: hypothetical protein ACI3XI_04145 [Eubacteriales bacterium]